MKTINIFVPHIITAIAAGILVSSFNIMQVIGIILLVIGGILWLDNKYEYLLKEYNK